MRRYFDTGLMAMLGLLTALIAGNGIVTYHHIGELSEARGKVDESRRALAALDGILGTLQDAESSVRGFLVTGEPAYLEAFRTARPRLETRLAELPQQFEARGDQADLALLQAGVRREVGLLEQLGAARDAQRLDAQARRGMEE